MDPSSRTISRGTEIITDAGRYSVNHDYSQEWNLVIDRIQRRDQGEYTCSVFLSATNRQDTDVRLDVHCKQNTGVGNRIAVTGSEFSQYVHKNIFSLTKFEASR